MNTLYSYQAVDNLIDRYIAKGGEALQTDKGVLGSGDWILYDFRIPMKLKFIIIKEIPIRSMSSSHSIRKYNTIPKKYLKIIEEKEG